ncbi:MAG: hypothetical protein ABW164_00580 [Sphingobium sp.]
MTQDTVDASLLSDAASPDPAIDRILDAALPCILTKGFDALTIRLGRARRDHIRPIAAGGGTLGADIFGEMLRFAHAQRWLLRIESFAEAAALKVRVRRVLMPLFLRTQLAAPRADLAARLFALVRIERGAGRSIFA